LAESISHKNLIRFLEQLIVLDLRKGVISGAVGVRKMYAYFMNWQDTYKTKMFFDLYIYKINSPKFKNKLPNQKPGTSTYFERLH
jgi:hypothetical protein